MKQDIRRAKSEVGRFRYAGSGGTINLDLNKHNDFAQDDTIGGAVTVKLNNAADGCQGTIAMKQGGTGRAVTIAALGCTVKSSASISTTAGALLAIGYWIGTIGSTRYCFVFASTMT